MSKKNYWKAHFVINPNSHSFQGTNYHSCGICEVHYENDKPVAWTENYPNISSTDESVEVAVEESQGLMKLYMKALNEPIYIIRKDADGKEFLEIYKKEGK